MNLVGPITGTWLPEETKQTLMLVIEEASFHRRWSIKKACETIGLNPDRYYAWKRKEDDPAPPCDQLLRVHRLLPEEKDAVLRMAEKYPTERHRKLAHLLLREEDVFISSSSVYRVLTAHQLVRGWIKDQRVWQKKDIKVDGPNQVWRSDITYVKVGTGHGYLILVLDKYSRKIVHHELRMTMTTRDWEEVLLGALEKEGLLDSHLKPKLITDNGTQPTSKRFKSLMKQLGMKHIRTAYRHPESNGQIEVANKTLKYEYLYVHEDYPFTNFLVAKKAILKAVNHYNHQRLHQALGFTTPEEAHLGFHQEIIKGYKSTKSKSLEARKRRNKERHQEQQTNEIIRVS